MLALAQASMKPDYPARIVAVASNNPEAPGLQVAADMEIPIIALDHSAFQTRQAFDRHLHQALLPFGPEIICCAGFMRILSPWFVKQWPNQVLNIHPSLLPKYKGLDTHRRAIDSGDEYHGCSVHYVNEVLDGGDVILQEKIRISQDDTPETLAAKVLTLEHPLYIKGLKKVALKAEFQNG